MEPGQVLSLVYIGGFGFLLSFLIGSETSGEGGTDLFRGLIIAAASWVGGACFAWVKSAVGDAKSQKPAARRTAILVSTIAIGLATGIDSDVVPWVLSIMCGAISGWLSSSFLLDSSRKARAKP